MGDNGFHPDYQDHSPQQSRHFWAFVDYGATQRPAKNLAGNIFHEVVQPAEQNFQDNAAKGSKIDYELSKAAVSAGEKLKSGKWTPLDFSNNLNKILKNKNTMKKYPYLDPLVNFAIDAAGQIVDIENQYKKSQK